jgi:hypothetical protein
MSKRRVIFAVFLVVLIIAGLTGRYFYKTLLSDKDLRDAIAEADRLDPGWRLEELEAKRASITAAENAAEHVLAIKASMPRPWPPDSMSKLPEPKPIRPGDEEPMSLEGKIFELAPDLQLNANQTQELRAAMEMVKGPLAKARTLMNFHAGRYAIQWSPDYFSTKLRWLDDCRGVTNLLWLDARLRAQDDDIEGALISILSILSVAKSFGDVPNLLSQIVRQGQSREATQVLEIALAQGQVSENTLAKAQLAFKEEASQPVLLFSVRGERAGYHQMMEAVKRGKVKASSLTGYGARGKLDKWWENVSGELELRVSHAPLIRITTQIVEIAKLPVEEQRPRYKSYIRSIDENDLPHFVKSMVPTEDTIEFFWRNQSHLRCAIVALAVERYRIAHHDWPDSLSSLVPEFLTDVPRDPYDARPLRYHRLLDGVVIYSIGPYEKDNGGKIDRQNSTRVDTNIGFQLWDVNRRRQPWHPIKKAVEEENE